ncbi:MULTISPECIES: hydantoinase/oxoprolinase family protein [unclassified Bradyrhizobium]|uniref:hydantoinase/oxoprolinase N-terminal domain-containing protein n=1 Tax=unclassified Bradyrhizobium TaxID=2631580 RepID=UPI001CD62302|nr:MULTISPECIES: hydantoinase/oxoprolinase family protein [unclassified Bradyrhizobium]MCA1386413.1 hydantoinase/oxoprolinase family protein [Bradyrhizobium sp. BRP05]MCA1394516.1 hydantoinase/oxoprolinase family protein [Bradyrhizobium sp. IC3123]MCA1424009.1 hydantoinase/oxoprolinase family protein [Bradyrhizobium sp. BRP23]MCA1431031.1 hydantoinase/oxoprolinase family protein [Bradyrhizobium sp. NBAIM16]MCA1436376.1 hydantoinase/oxoprolinase family protein [Bradyrhizobium sp. BRP20]
MRRIGIDVGGTNTDAVLIDGGKVVQGVKVATTADVTSGVAAAIGALDLSAEHASGLDALMIGTTHFINAVVQRRHLTKVAVIRVALPATSSLPPFTDWPAGLAELANGGVFQIEGGHDYDGRRFAPLDIAAAKRIAREIGNLGLKYVVVNALFSPLDPSDEEAVAAILREEIPDVSVTCAHLLGGIGLLERENAAILNASLIALARETITAFEQAKSKVGLNAPLFVTQNDGTVAEASRAAAYPVFSFASGATNSMRGAAYLSGLKDAVVVDVGGTTADFGYLRNGFPREANTVVHIGGVRTLFRMPDLVSIGLGGGSHIDLGAAAIGPLSVGYRLSTEALVFGGNRVTSTDIGVAAGLIDLGDRKRVAHITADDVKRVLRRCKEMLEENVDRMKTSASDVTLIAVGGGAFLVPEELQGVGRVVRVQHGGCANAVGAAIAQVSGEVDQVFQGLTRDEAVASARKLADSRAVEAGADSESLALVEAEDTPIAYLPGNAMRVRVKVVGNIRSTRIGQTAKEKVTCQSVS